MIGLKAPVWRVAASVMCPLPFSCCTGNLAVRHCLGTAAGGMTLASNSLGSNALTGVGSPVIVQVPNVSAVHTLSLPPPTLAGSAATAVVAAVAQQELRQQQQQSQQVCLRPTGQACLLPSWCTHHTAYTMSSMQLLHTCCRDMCWLSHAMMHALLLIFQM